MLNQNITLINSSISISNNKLQLLYQGNIVHEFTLYYLNSDTYKIIDKNIYIKGSLSYTEFIQNISLNGMSYKIFNANENNITSGNIDDNYSMKLYLDDVLLDTYTIKTEYLEINNLDIKEEDKIIYNISLDTTYNDLLKNVNTNGIVTVVDYQGNKVSLDSKVKTSDVLIIKLISSETRYTLSVFGDVTGSGSVTAGDVAKLYQNVKGKITFDEISILAGDVTKNGKIEINDVAKAYTYLKGKLSSLE